MVQQAIKLKLNNPSLSLRKIAKITGRNVSNVSRALKRYDIDIKRLTGYKAHRADILAGIQDKMLAAIDDDKLSRASVKDISISVGILYDKERLSLRLRDNDI